ncbi:MAG TPA: phosphatase PAP2 family protein [Jatrophihabitans sp.]|nr:phosphatase PAP2 family protein [Jatrophihabitans sp.]
MVQADLDPSQRDTEPAAPSDPTIGRRLTVLRRSAVLVWAVALVYWVHRVGLTFDRNTLLIYVCAGLIAASIGRRGVLSVLRDWLPFVAMLVLYDLTRGAAEALGRPTEWHFQLDFDKRLFAGTEPTVWLQAHLKEPFPPWWEILVSLIYVSYFFAPYAVAGVLWLRDRAGWRRFAVRFIVISFIGLIGFVAFPAAPPWAAAQCSAAQVANGPSDPPCIEAKVGTVTDGGMLGTVHASYPGAAPYIERVASRGWNKLGIPQAKALVDEGQAGANEVAAVPSLHAAISGLLTVFFWPRVRRRWRPLLALYSVAMGFSLVYGAEHYVFDILLGWLLTVVVCFALNRWDAARARRREDAPDTLDPSTVPRP